MLAINIERGLANFSQERATILDSANAVGSRKPFCSSTWNECCVKRMNANRAIRIAAQRTQGLWGLISVFGVGGVDMTANER